VESARAQVKLAQADLLPLVSWGADAQRSRSTRVGTNPLPPGFSPLTTDYRLALNA
jgi:outer membrane protein TolC